MSSSIIYAVGIKHKELSNTNTNDYTKVNYDITKHKFHSGVEYTSGKWNALLDAQYIMIDNHYIILIFYIKEDL